MEINIIALVILFRQPHVPVLQDMPGSKKRVIIKDALNDDIAQGDTNLGKLQTPYTSFDRNDHHQLWTTKHEPILATMLSRRMISTAAACGVTDEPTGQRCGSCPS